MQPQPWERRLTWPQNLKMQNKLPAKIREKQKYMETTKPQTAKPPKFQTFW